MTEEEIRNLFREMRDETVPADAVARVRARVADRVERKARWKIGAWFAAAATVLAAVLLILPQSRVHNPADAPRIARKPDRPPPELPAFTPRLTVRPAIRRRRPRTEDSAAAPLIRIETSDPEVVILLIADNQNERKQE
jgi:hypothetical protein